MSKCNICGSTRNVGYTLSSLGIKCCAKCYSKLSIYKDDLLTTMDINNNSTNSKCSRCAQCCIDFIPMTNTEILKIKTYIKEHNIERNIAHDENGNIYIMCPFVSDEGCMIYDVRPKICRTFACWKSKNQLVKNKIILNTIADINNVDNNFKSLHEIFYGDTEYSKLLKEKISKGDFKYKT